MLTACDNDKRVRLVEVGEAEYLQVVTCKQAGKGLPIVIDVDDVDS